FRVLDCRSMHATAEPARQGRDLMRSLDEFVARVTAAVAHGDAEAEIRDGLADLFGITHSVVLPAEGNGVVGVAVRRRQGIGAASVPAGGGGGSACARGHAESRRPVRLLETDRVRSVAAVPFGVGGEPSGVLYMESEQPGFFCARMEQLLRILGGMLAVAL